MGMSGLIDKISVLGRDFTIQTEFIDGEEAKIRTLVYDGGRMVTSREIRSGSTIDIGGETDTAVRLQHMRITENLTERAADFGAAKTSSPPPPPTSPPVAAAPRPALKKTTRPPVEPGSHLETAIAVRQTIGPFGIAFAHPAPTTAAGYEQALALVDAALDAIREAPTYDTIRLDEQLTLIALKVLSRDDRTRPQDRIDALSLLAVATPDDLTAARSLLTTIEQRGYARNRDLASAFDALVAESDST